jgi:hypothetical protein
VVSELSAHPRGIRVIELSENGQRLPQAVPRDAGIAIGLARGGQVSQDLGLVVLVAEFPERAQ